MPRVGRCRQAGAVPDPGGATSESPPRADDRVSAVLLVERLSKLYGDLLALDDVGFAVEPGQIVGLPGPERGREDDDDAGHHGPGRARSTATVHVAGRPVDRRGPPAVRVHARPSAACTSGWGSVTTSSTTGGCRGGPTSRRPSGRPTEWLERLGLADRAGDPVQSAVERQPAAGAARAGAAQRARAAGPRRAVLRARSGRGRGARARSSSEQVADGRGPAAQQPPARPRGRRVQRGRDRRPRAGGAAGRRHRPAGGEPDAATSRSSSRDADAVAIRRSTCAPTTAVAATGPRSAAGSDARGLLADAHAQRRGDRPTRSRRPTCPRSSWGPSAADVDDEDARRRRRSPRRGKSDVSARRGHRARRRRRFDGRDPADRRTRDPGTAAGEVVPRARPRLLVVPDPGDRRSSPASLVATTPPPSRPWWAWTGRSLPGSPRRWTQAAGTFDRERRRWLRGRHRWPRRAPSRTATSTCVVVHVRASCRLRRRRRRRDRRRSCSRRGRAPRSQRGPARCRASTPTEAGEIAVAGRRWRRRPSKATTTTRTGLAMLTGTVTAVLLFLSLQMFGNYVLVGGGRGEVDGRWSSCCWCGSGPTSCSAGKLIGHRGRGAVAVRVGDSRPAWWRWPSPASTMPERDLVGAADDGRCGSSAATPLYSTLFALAGSLVSRQEDAQAAAGADPHGADRRRTC